MLLGKDDLAEPGRPLTNRADTDTDQYTSVELSAGDFVITELLKNPTQVSIGE